MESAARFVRLPVRVECCEFVSILVLSNSFAEFTRTVCRVNAAEENSFRRFHGVENSHTVRRGKQVDQ